MGFDIMVAISFSKKPEFPEMIRNGTKDQTIRPLNVERFEQIERIKKLQLYWKQRTKECYKIADADLIEMFKIKLVHEGDEWIYIWNETICTYSPATYEIAEIIRRDGLTHEEFYPLFLETYSNIEDMEFMVIRFKVIK